MERTWSLDLGRHRADHWLFCSEKAVRGGRQQAVESTYEPAKNSKVARSQVSRAQSGCSMPAQKVTSVSGIAVPGSKAPSMRGFREQVSLFRCRRS